MAALAGRSTLELGASVLATVYRAAGHKHGRGVAIEVHRPALASVLLQHLSEEIRRKVEAGW